MKQKKEQSLSGLWDYHMVSYIRVIRVSGERGLKKYLRKQQLKTSQSCQERNTSLQT